MKNAYRKIGEQWVNLNPSDILWETEFTGGHCYKDYVERGKRNIERYVDKNKTMLSLVAQDGYGSDYAFRQIIYSNSGLSNMTARLQTEGRRYYRNKVLKAIKAAITTEYENLPKFFRDAYSIDDIACSYFNEATADLKNEINKAATQHFYQSMRHYINTLF